MENNLQTALTQIKRPVRYDEKQWMILDAEGSAWIENHHSHPIGHYLAECINGMGDGVKLQDVLGQDKPWPLTDVLKKLIDASEVLLHKKDYDGYDYEEIEHCVKRAKETIILLSKFLPESSANAMQGEGLSAKEAVAIRAIRANYQRWKSGEIKDGAFVFHIETNLKALEDISQAPAREVRSAESFFQSKNGGKHSHTSVEHGETFTAIYVVQMMQEYANQFK